MHAAAEARGADDHALFAGENQTLNIPLTLVAKDAAGNTITTAGFTVAVGDDAPAVTATHSIVTNNDGATNRLGLNTGLEDRGADSALVTELGE